MPSKKIMFTGHAGDELAARLDLPENGEIRAYALFAHCFTCGKDLRAISRISQALNAEGIALFRFDFTGLGMSKGDFANTHFSSNVEDLVAAANYMKQHYEAPSFLIGHSLGGTACLVAAKHIPSLKAIATIGSPSNATNVLKQFSADVKKIETEGFADVELSGRPFTIKKEFIENARQQDVASFVKRLGIPYLILHSPVDATVDIDHARLLFMAAKHPKSFVSLDTADHLLLKGDKHSYYAGRMLATWVGQYL